MHAVAVTVFDPKSLFGILGVLLAVIGVLAAGWGAFKSQAASGWRLAAEGYKEQVTELSGRLNMAEQVATSMQQRVDKLEQLPDLRAIVAAIDGNTAEVIREIKAEALATRVAITDAKGVLDGTSPPSPA